MEMIECGCGCGAERPKLDKYGIERKYINGHQTKNRKMPDSQKKKLSEVWWKNRKHGANKGKKFSDEHKRKLSEARKNNIHILKKQDEYCDSFHDNEYRDYLRKDHCEECNMSNKDSLLRWNERLSLHHKNGNKKDNRPNEIRTLCRSCHAKEDWKIRKAG